MRQMFTWVAGAQVAVIGVPNAGKSTLTNKLVGQKASPRCASARKSAEHAAGLCFPVHLSDAR